MNTRVPSVPVVMLASMAVFQIAAAFATFVPAFVHDRVPEQFIPVWTFLTKPVFGDTPDDSMIRLLAIASQYVIGASEAIIGITLLGAAFSSRHRISLANFGLGYAMGLFTAFMLTMFAMHDKKLPAWNQYPAILAWIGVTWLVVSLTDRNAGRSTHTNGNHNRPEVPRPASTTRLS